MCIDNDIILSIRIPTYKITALSFKNVLNTLKICKLLWIKWFTKHTPIKNVYMSVETRKLHIL